MASPSGGPDRDAAAVYRVGPEDQPDDDGSEGDGHDRVGHHGKGGRDAFQGHRLAFRLASMGPQEDGPPEAVSTCLVKPGQGVRRQDLGMQSAPANDHCGQPRAGEASRMAGGVQGESRRSESRSGGNAQEQFHDFERDECRVIIVTQLDNFCSQVLEAIKYWKCAL